MRTLQILKQAYCFCGEANGYLGIQQGMCEKDNLELEFECEEGKADFLLKIQE